MPILERGGEKNIEMGKKTICCLALFILFLVVPFSLNMFIGLDAPNNIKIVGEGKDWVAFFGSYIGSIFAVAGSLLICYITISHTSFRLTLDLRHREIMETQRELANRFEQFEPDEILPCSQVFQGLKNLNEKEESPEIKVMNALYEIYTISQGKKKGDSALAEDADLKKEMDRLQNLHTKCSKLSYSAKMLYYDNKSNKSKEFLDSYNEMLQDSKETIEMLIMTLRNENKGEWKSSVANISRRISKLKEANLNAIKKAYEFRDSLIEDLNQKQESEVNNVFI